MASYAIYAGVETMSYRETRDFPSFASAIAYARELAFEQMIAQKSDKYMTYAEFVEEWCRETEFPEDRDLSDRDYEDIDYEFSEYVESCICYHAVKEVK